MRRSISARRCDRAGRDAAGAGRQAGGTGADLGLRARVCPHLPSSGATSRAQRSTEVTARGRWITADAVERMPGAVSQPARRCTGPPGQPPSTRHFALPVIVTVPSPVFVTCAVERAPPSSRRRRRARRQVVDRQRRRVDRCPARWSPAARAPRGRRASSGRCRSASRSADRRRPPASAMLPLPVTDSVDALRRASSAIVEPRRRRRRLRRRRASGVESVTTVGPAAPPRTRCSPQPPVPVRDRSASCRRRRDVDIARSLSASPVTRRARAMPVVTRTSNGPSTRTRSKLPTETRRGSPRRRREAGERQEQRRASDDRHAREHRRYRAAAQVGERDQPPQRTVARSHLA